MNNIREVFLYTVFVTSSFRSPAGDIKRIKDKYECVLCDDFNILAMDKEAFQLWKDAANEILDFVETSLNKEDES